MHLLPEVTAMKTNAENVFILNFAPHYRKEIFLLLERELKADFFFADKTLARGLEKMDYTFFRKRPIELKFLRIYKNFSWIKRSIQIPFLYSYKNYIITGEPFCLSSWMLMLIVRSKGKRVFTWTHGMHGGEKGLKKFIKILYFKLSNANFLYGNYAKEVMLRYGFSESGLHVIYNSFHYSNNLYLRKELQRSKVFLNYFCNDYPVIIFIGRLRPQKKLGMLISAHALLLHEYNFPVNLFIVGDGPESEHLKMLIHLNNTSDHVFFYGSCYDDLTNATFIFNADLCVSPGEVGLTAVHSLSYGTPVITHNNFATQMPEFEAIVRGESGDFFTENKIDALAAIIYKWLTAYPQKSDRVVQNCFSVIDQFYNPQFQLKIFKSVLGIPRV